MAVGRLGKLLAGLALLVASVAIVWPGLVTWQRGDVAGRCPWGFDSPSFSFTPFSALQEANVTHIFFNATFWTADPEAPLAEAMAVDRDSGRIVALGATDTLVSGAPTSVVRVDLRGGHVAPGFVDAHVHFLTGGLTLRQLDLRRVASKAEFVAAVRAAVQQGGSNGEAGGAGGEENGASSGGGSSRDSMLHGGWLLGYGWDESRFGGELPTSAWVDEGTSGGVPALLTRTDGHMALASTAALQAAGLWPAAPDLGECGEVGADAEGRPTGILTESCAITLVSKHVPAWGLEDRKRAARDAAEYALARGVTSVADMGRFPWDEQGSQPWDDLEHVLAPLADARQLRTRIHAMMPLPTWRRLAARVAAAGRRHPGGRLQWGALKEFADGSLGSRTALMHNAYAGGRDGGNNNRGARVTPLASLERWAADASGADLQVALHAIGDRAVDDVLSLYGCLPPLEQQQVPFPAGSPREGAGNTPSPTTADELRHRVEHTQHLSGPAAAAAAAAAGARIVANPLHLLDDMGVMRERLGAERAGPGRSYALRTLLAAGAKTSFGSDWPVVGMDPLLGMYIAVARRDFGQPPEAAWAPKERITGEEAFYAHTRWAAEACWMDDEVGSLRRGLRADFVVLSGSPVLSEEQAELPAVVSTYMDGRCQHGCRRVRMARLVSDGMWQILHDP